MLEIVEAWSLLAVIDKGKIMAVVREAVERIEE